MSYQLHIGDSLEVLKTLPANSIDSVVTDPPYGLEFMGKAWDKYTPGAFQLWCEQWATECLRVLKPGGYLVAFGGTRTYHRLASGVEDAGFEIRDKLDWIYGSGFPKSLDVSKAIDKAAGAEREVIGADPEAGRRNKAKPRFNGADYNNGQEYQGATEVPLTAPATDAAKQWEGWGTALKPAHEPIVLARKPLSENTVAANVLEHGTGGLNIDGSRVASESRPKVVSNRRSGNEVYGDGLEGSMYVGETTEGRWPPNILLSHSPYCTNIRQRRIEDPASWDCSEGCPVAEMDKQSGVLTSGTGAVKRDTGKGHESSSIGTESRPIGTPMLSYGDTGGASRFFPIIEWDDHDDDLDDYVFNFKYQAKAAKKERPSVDGVAAHPTVKPVALMRWLVKLVTPPGGMVLEPFGGSGTTAEACELEGFDCTIVEREPDYAKLIEARMAKYIVSQEVA